MTSWSWQCLRCGDILNARIPPQDHSPASVHVWCQTCKQVTRFTSPPIDIRAATCKEGK